MTSAHPPFDTRIFHKEAISLAETGYEVHLVTPSHEDCTMAGVRIHGVTPRTGRRSRMIRTAKDAYRVALSLHADIYHFHDPELIPFGILLKLQGRRVIYDVHEDLPQDILVKDWLAPWMRRPVAITAGMIEKIAARLFDHIVAATPSIAKRFPAQKTSIVQNFPDELFCSNQYLSYSDRSASIVYVGSISEARGAREMVSAVGMLPSHIRASLCMAGEWDHAKLATELAFLPGWNRVEYLGTLQRAGVRKLLGQSRVGIAVLHPTSAFLESQPTKLYEYMSAGIPVVVSNFPYWRKIVEGCRCGLTVDPMNPSAIANALQWLLEHPREAQDMGQRGRQAVLQHYNWEQQAQVLRTLYDRILKD